MSQTSWQIGEEPTGSARGGSKVQHSALDRPPKMMSSRAQCTLPPAGWCSPSTLLLLSPPRPLSVVWFFQFKGSHRWISSSLDLYRGILSRVHSHAGIDTGAKTMRKLNPSFQGLLGPWNRGGEPEIDPNADIEGQGDLVTPHQEASNLS